MSKAVFCIAKTREQAERIVDHLQNEGFSTDDISILFADRDNKITTSLGSFDTTKTPKKSALGHEKHTKASEGAATGATAGGIIGGSLGLLAGIGALAIPGVGPFIAAGPIMGALSGSAVGGGLGLLLGSLVGLGMPEYEAKRYEQSIKAGNVLISVHTDNSDEISQAKKIFESEKAQDISPSTEKTKSRS